jgi:UPF0755 protein
MRLVSLRSFSENTRRSSVRTVLVRSIAVLLVGLVVAHVGARLLFYEAREDETPPVAFPVGVDPARRAIAENPDVEGYFKEYVLHEAAPALRVNWVRRLLSKLALREWYQELASPTGRILVILSGERKEEVAEHFGSILGWDRVGRRTFMELVASSSPELVEGKFAPHTYLTARTASPEETALLVIAQFQKDILSRYSSAIAEAVPLTDALTIASLLEREGRDFEDMRQISGIIWNRLFAGMKLQLDATLQYAKGSRAGEPWWPAALPADKQIASTFNTYKHAGLPPAPIANPSLEAILAALNPKVTDCMYYFHDKDGGFHCSATYEEHVALLKQYYGNGE